MKKYIFILSILLVATIACNKDFLNKVPLNQLTTQTAFVNYANFQTYAYGLYDYMAGYGNSGSTMPPNYNSQEYANSDNISSGTPSPYVTQTKLAPAAAPVPSNGFSTYSQSIS